MKDLKESVYHGAIVSALAIGYTVLGKTLIKTPPPPPLALGKFDVEDGLTLLPTGGGFLSHTTIVSAATLKPLKLWLPNFVISCFYLFVTIWEKFSWKSICQGGCYSHFQTRGHEKLETRIFFLFVKNGWDT